MSTQPLNRVIREFLAQLVATGAPDIVDAPFSPAGFRFRLRRKRVRGMDEILDPFPVRAPSTVTHYVLSSSVICPDISEEDRAVLRDEIEAIVFRYLNPLDMMLGIEHTLWLQSETEYSQMARVLALSPEDEGDYLYLARPTAHWTGPIRGLHKTMATLAQLLSRHPDFATGKIMCRSEVSFLFLGEAQALNRVPTTGIGIDGRNVPSRGVFAIDTESYMDALVQLGEEEARHLTAVEFRYAGPCVRALGPLGVPIYRIPHSIPPAAIRSMITVATNDVIYGAAEEAAPV